jgi:orotidine-5'-phosphate decarboxylase
MRHGRSVGRTDSRERFGEGQLQAREKLIVALDLPTAQTAMILAGRLAGRAGLFKVGSELFTAEGGVLPRFLAAAGERVFLDLKFHDIPNTVRAACREGASLGVRMMNVHASGGRKMMEAALEGAHEGAAGGPRPLILAVTILTSIGAEVLAEVGISGTPEEAVVRLARLAQVAGVDGVVASPREIAAVRSACGSNFVIVTPGIRPAQAAVDDQVRIATPRAAIEAGANYIVVGRPITAAQDPAEAAQAIVEEMEQAHPSLVAGKKG